MVKIKENLTGKKFGKLTVIEQTDDYIYPNGKRRLPQWLCQCDCGNKIIVLQSSLKHEKTKSCGCLYSNNYDLSGEYGVGYDCNGNPFYFDLEDYDKIKKYCWHLDKDNYVCANVNGTTIKMHRIILGLHEEKIQVDHIFHNNNDNRKSKLRVVTNQQNSMNKDKPINNTSGHRGVSFYEKRNKWRVYITINGERKHLGYFDKDKLNEAIQARLNAENKYFGKYSYNNSVKYNIQEGVV